MTESVRQARSMIKRKLEDRWKRLDPIFIMGMQRSGTSIVARAMHQAGLKGFGEGHIWFEFLRPVVRLGDPSYRRNLRHEVYALGGERPEVFGKYLALAIDQFHRDQLGCESDRWYDKSPGSEAVTSAPVLASIFPKSCFLFLHRNGIANVHSALKKWPGSFERQCEGWTATMSNWRRVRGELSRRTLEVAQEELASNPDQLAERIALFTNQPEHVEKWTELFRTKRVLSSFPDKAPGDYAYKIDWSRDQKEYFRQNCGEEMHRWGYPMAFD